MSFRQTRSPFLGNQLGEPAPPPPAAVHIKTVNGVLLGFVKTFNGIPKANVKTKNGVTAN